MYSYLFLTFFSFYSWGASTQEIEQAKRSIKILIRPLIPGERRKPPQSLKNFRVDGCQKYKINWSEILLLKRSITLNYSFKDGCDIEGSITPKILIPFPVKLGLRHLDPYNKMESENKITASLESRPIMLLEIRSGLLSGTKGTVKFEADYQIQIDPIADTEPREKDLGGELRITEIYGNKTDIKEKIKIQ